MGKARHAQRRRRQRPASDHDDLGVTACRLDWLRAGPLDGNPANNLASLLLSGDRYLPRVTARGNAAAAPPVDLMGPLMGTPDRAAVAGGVRANGNIALTALHTLFAREHNRIVTQLPSSLTQEEKFQIARRIIGAELHVAGVSPSWATGPTA